MELPWNSRVQGPFIGNTFIGVDRTTQVFNTIIDVANTFEKVKPIGHGKEVAAYLGS